MEVVCTLDTHTLRIALINSVDYGGGAENVTRMLRDGLLQRGHNAVLWVGRRYRQEKSEHTHTIPCTVSERRSAARWARKGFFNLGIRSSRSFCESTALSGRELIHLHNLHGHYLSMTVLPYLAARFPLVWTLHDFFPITGGCAFPQDCDKWMSQCGSCPQLGQYPLATKYDRTRRMQSVKRRIFADLPITIVTPSRHLYEAVRRSNVFRRADVRIIPYGVDTEVFHPHRQAARRHLGIPPGAPTVLLAAQGLNDPRKGIYYAAEALRNVNLPELVVLLVGGGDTEKIVEALGRYQICSLGYVTDQRALSRCYAAADLFIFTSLAENFPCVVQEAMACGTAVLAFNINGVDEQITDGRTGFLVPVADTDALSQAAARLLRNSALLADVGASARRHAEKHWKVDLFIQRHERLYRSILECIPMPR